jgi:hypothetical protein
MVTDYTKTYTSYSGCDIAASFNGKVIGELQAITYSVSREKAPIYTMGSAEPRSFSRGKRGIAGTLVFTVFNRDSLIEEMNALMKEKNLGIQKFAMNTTSAIATATDGQQYLSIEDWDAQMSKLAAGSGTTNGGTGATTGNLVQTAPAYYADEILPFDITVTFANEYGQRAVMMIYGVELLNEGSGYSIDSVTTEKAYTFVARKIDYMKSVDNDNDVQLSTTF